MLGESGFENTSVEQLERIFKEILNVKVNVIEDLDNLDQQVFMILINELEILINNEDELENKGVDIAPVVDPYYRVIEMLIRMHFGPSTTELIEWYLFARKDKDGNILPFKNSNGSEVIIKTPEDLWTLVQKIGFL